MAVIKYEAGREVDGVKYEESDLLLTTIVNIHALTVMSNPPQLPDKEELLDYYVIDINFVDANGNTSYMTDATYYVVEQDGEYYLIEGQHGFIYQIEEQKYMELELLFD